MGEGVWPDAVQVKDPKPINLTQEVGSIRLEEEGAPDVEHCVDVVFQQALHVVFVALSHLNLGKLRILRKSIPKGVTPQLNGYNMA